MEVHPKFRLFLVTGRNKASADPEHLSTFTIVNFTLCAAGSAESTLAAMLRTQLVDVGPRQENLLAVQVIYHESRTCSRDTYPESYITKYTSIRK